MHALFKLMALGQADMLLLCPEGLSPSLLVMRARSAWIASIAREVHVQQSSRDAMLVQEVECRNPVAELIVAAEPIPILGHAQGPFGFIESTFDLTKAAFAFCATVRLKSRVSAHSLQL